MIINEGRVRLYVPENKKDVFYNPEMELSRDISVAFLQSVGNIRVACDLLSATGARAVRYAKETGVERVFANDANKESTAYIMKNAAANGVTNKIASFCSGANPFLQAHAGEFDFIDIDPFGSPIYFLEQLAKSAKKDSYVAITATDCGTLSGIFSNTCARRYGVTLKRTACYRETGIRNLLGAVAAFFGKENKSIHPMISHATEHYFRIFFRVIPADTVNVKNFYHCPRCDFSTFRKFARCGLCGSKSSVLGPLWAGKLYDRKLCFDVLGRLDGKFGRAADARRLVLAILEEIEEPFYYDIHRMASRASVNTPSIKDVMGRLRRAGFSASRTQFSGTSIKTDAPASDVEKITGLSCKPKQPTRAG